MIVTSQCSSYGIWDYSSPLNIKYDSTCLKCGDCKKPCKCELENKITNLEAYIKNLEEKLLGMPSRNAKLHDLISRIARVVDDYEEEFGDYI